MEYVELNMSDGIKKGLKIVYLRNLWDMQMKINLWYMQMKICKFGRGI